MYVIYLNHLYNTFFITSRYVKPPRRVLKVFDIIFGYSFGDYYFQNTEEY